MIEKKENIDSSLIPTVEINTQKMFGVDMFI